ncbi:MAG: nuclear transport factor 2 family protein [Thermoleophilaceae bacterium]
MDEGNVSEEERTRRRAELVGRLYNDGWAGGNLDAGLELLDPGIVWTAIEGAPDAGTYRGHEGVRAYWQDWLDDFDIDGVLVEEAIQAGDRLMCVQRAVATGKGSGVQTELEYACLYTFGDDERIVEVNEYAAREEALAAA